MNFLEKTIQIPYIRKMTKYWRKGNFILFEVQVNKVTCWKEYLFKAGRGNRKRVSPRYSRFKKRWNCTVYGIFPDENNKRTNLEWAGSRRTYVYSEFCVSPGLNDL